MDTDKVELVLELLLCFEQERSTLGELFFDLLHGGNVVDLTLADLLPEKFGIAQEENHVLLLEAYSTHMLLELVCPAEALSDTRILFFKSHFGVLRHS
jgi:hypothetical protein